MMKIKSQENCVLVQTVGNQNWHWPTRPHLLVDEKIPMVSQLQIPWNSTIAMIDAVFGETIVWENDLSKSSTQSILVLKNKASVLCTVG